MEGSRTYIHTSVDLFKAQRDSQAFETCWKTLRKTSSNWCVSRSIVFEVGVVFKNVSESGWVSELQLFFLHHTNCIPATLICNKGGRQLDELAPVMHTQRKTLPPGSYPHTQSFQAFCTGYSRRCATFTGLPFEPALVKRGILL